MWAPSWAPRTAHNRHKTASTAVLGGRRVGAVLSPCLAIGQSLKVSHCPKVHQRSKPAPQQPTRRRPTTYARTRMQGGSADKWYEFVPKVGRALPANSESGHVDTNRCAHSSWVDPTAQSLAKMPQQGSDVVTISTWPGKRTGAPISIVISHM